MTNAYSLFRSLVIYGICLPLAIFIGYLLATPTDFTTYSTVVLLLSLMTVPLFLKWHYPWLILVWNSTAGLYFLPGKPTLTLTMIAVSFFISLLTYIMNRNIKFISVPSLSRPLIFIAIVVLVTGKLTGSLGLSVFGSDVMGGKRYIYLLSAIIGFFALTAQHIPAQKADLYVKLFYLGAITAVIGMTANFVDPSFGFIFLIFPGELNSTATPFDAGINRLAGLSASSIAIITYMLARYGLQGVLDSKKIWRCLIFFCLVVASMFGGYRSKVIYVILLCSFMFYMERLHRTRMLPVFLLAAVLGGSFVASFSDRLPLSVQRSLTFIPGLDLDKDAVINAKASSEWRLTMWADVIPTIPHYLILGKGLGIDAHDMEMARMGFEHDTSAGAAMAGDYHNGPLSVIIPFGIPGVIGFVWFLVAAGRALHQNYKNGEPEYERINRFLFVTFIVQIVMFCSVFGSFYGDMTFFAGIVGFSVALNGGIRKPAVAPALPQMPIVRKLQLADAAARS